ncbi:MAG: RagB/SusD family nutrient uptake outer membrane protein [Lewinellaceae bacterium]|nr:RagB/SusD family nutrient uptake outer membrane protein [Saprospiraceae bacterium]MCB9337705.1 RagB/SusD family nutrient uptake outer membrane protein [Lewinellaceae bacterium]
MNNPTFPFLCFLMGCILFSCNGFLDDPQPTDQLPITQVFETGSDLEAALVGAYDLIQDGDAMGGLIPALPDLMAYNAKGWFEEVSTLQMEPTYWVTENLWTQCYRAINQVNAILQALPDVVVQDAAFREEDAHRIEGEARFIRGVLYFELVRLYALPYGDGFLEKPGVPLMLEPVLAKQDIGFPARATVGKVYGQVLQDLEKAKDLLPETNARGRATQFAAMAYLARLAFQQRDYEKAASLAGDILAREDLFQLTETPQDFFIQEGSMEEIWVIVGSGESDPIVGGLSSVYNDAPETAGITDDLKENGYAALLTEDQRQGIQNAGYQFVDLRCDPANLYSGGNLLVLGDTARCNKYENSWLPGEDDAPTVRLAEMMLMRAEALARTQGINAESIDLINKIRRRSMRVLDENGVLVPVSDSLISFKAADFIDMEALCEAIIRERRVELAFDGNYFHDLMRLQREVLNNGKVYSYQDNKLRLPIPQREVDANPNLEQNP